MHIERTDSGWRLEVEQFLARPLEEVFSFFASAENLQTLTPPQLHFEILTPRPIEMNVGTLIDYRLRLWGVPLRWRSQITAWEPPFRFVDEQRQGPYRRWVHEHSFESREGGTLVRDRVDYAVPGGGLVHRLIVKPDLDRIFRFRRRKLLEIFPGSVGESGLGQNGSPG